MGVTPTALLGLSGLAGKLPASLVALLMSLPLPQPVVFVPRLLPLHLLLSLLALLLLDLGFDDPALIDDPFGATEVTDTPTCPGALGRGTYRSKALSRIAQALRSMLNIVNSASFCASFVDSPRRIAGTADMEEFAADWEST